MDNKRLAIEEHYRSNYKKLVKLVSYRLGGNFAVAEEALQEAYLRALLYAHLCEDLPKWFNRILNNTVADFRRNEQLKGATNSEEELDYLPDPYYTISRSETSHLKVKLEKMIDEVVNTSHKEVLRLHFIEELTPTEIGYVTEGISVEASHKVIQRFRGKLFEEFNINLD